MGDASCDVTTHSFKDSILGQSRSFYFVFMSDSFLVWIGNSAHPNFSQLSVALLHSLSNKAVASNLFGNWGDQTSTSLASKLSQRTKKQVFVSYNLGSDDLNLSSLVERRIVQEITTHPAF